jgi:hypothetical protein
MRKYLVFVARGLPHIHLLLKNTMEKGILDVKLPERPSS